MASHIISRRIQYIIQYIHDYPFPTKDEILDFLIEKDFKVSSRTMERDLERIRADFGLEIAYDKRQQGYFIDESKSVKVASFFKFLEIVSVADILSESLKDSNKIFDYVAFDDSKSFKGIENLKVILIGIKQKRKLSFVHENYHTNKRSNYTITPLLLKEYENRWYAVGVPDNKTEIRTFGVDRITDLSVNELSNIKRKDYNKQLKKFDTVVGLYFDNHKPQKVRLLVASLHVKYMRSLPLHHSQIIHSENEQGESFVDFFLIPNYEFITQILKIGDEVEVIYPLELREKVKKVLQNTLDKY